LTLAANLAFIAFAVYVFRANAEHQAAQANELAVREVNHRIKNSLQMISSLIHMRSRKIDDEGYHRAVEDMTSQLTAVAETYRFVQSSASLDRVDITKTLMGLCAYLQKTYETRVELEPSSPLLVDAAHATTLAIVVNELVTNGIKHGDGRVTVSCKETQDTLRIEVKNSGPPLPKGFSMGKNQGFGLRAVTTMVEGLGGKVVADEYRARRIVRSGSTDECLAKKQQVRR
jgi:two-component sensor histidine kinase